MDKSKIIKIFGVILLLVWAVATGWLGVNYWQTKNKLENNDAKAVVKKLEEHMQVPLEEPLVATITDAEKLKKDEQFYKNAVNGDKVVIWRDKAVIYRMSDDRIVDFGVVVRTPTQGTSQATPSAAPNQ
jgi:Na+-translocating ferredoxin:NAD+ oxidoreductase RnfG subunit